MTGQRRLASAATMPASDLQTFASRLANAARQVTLAQVHGAIVADNKGNADLFDPVTAADRSAEQAMRAIIATEFADHGISGEEFGNVPGSSRYSWSLDPIDGTRSYICGLPTWTTLIALLDDGEPVLGLIDAPRLDERYIGDGATSWCETGDAQTSLRCSECTGLAEARLSTTDPFLFGGGDAEAFAELQNRARTTRYGLDAYAYARLAAGTLDLVVECGLKPHDYHALIPVVRSASGVFGDWNGGSDFGDGNVIAAATPQLYAAAVEIMSARRDAAAAP